jgi:hypothetical protein
MEVKVNKEAEKWKKKRAKYHTYLKTPKWKAKRVEIFNERGCRCERCMIDVRKIEYHVHHKTYDNIFNEKNLDLELLCKKCHEKEHGIESATPKKLKVFHKKTQKAIGATYIETVRRNHAKHIMELDKKFVSKKITKLEYDIKTKREKERFIEKMTRI